MPDHGCFGADVKTSLTISPQKLIPQDQVPNRFGLPGRIKPMDRTQNQTPLDRDALVDRECDASPTITGDARDQIGIVLRSIYADLCETQPITDVQVDLLLRLRHKERDRRRAA